MSDVCWSLDIEDPTEWEVLIPGLGRVAPWMNASPSILPEKELWVERLIWDRWDIEAMDRPTVL